MQSPADLNPLSDDLEHILSRTRGLWDALRGQRVFVTGGTGFFGRWLLESFAHANTTLGLGAQIVVLTRDDTAFRVKAPHLADDPTVKLVRGDVRNFNAAGVQAQLDPGAAPGYAFMIHAATESSTQSDPGDSLRMVDTVVQGTRAALEFAREAGVRRFLFTSSGAVYGRQPPELTHLPEEFSGGPDCTQPTAAYAEGKRLAEMLCACFYQRHGLETLMARCFAFVGPHLPLDAHFAVGNFIRDALRGGHLEIKGDGTPYRSYLYAADLAIWLWTILLKGTPGRPYNVGSEDGLPIGKLAATVAETLGTGRGVTIARKAVPGVLPERYVPSTRRARTELGLEQTVGLEEGIRRTAHFASLKNSQL